jgi:hypothetical protein
MKSRYCFGFGLVIFPNPKCRIIAKTYQQTLAARERVLQPDDIPKIIIKPRRNIHQRRAYAARRAIMAIDRFSGTTSPGSSAEHVRALRWMRLWMDFALGKDAAAVQRPHRRRQQMHIDRENPASGVS